MAILFVKVNIHVASQTFEMSYVEVAIQCLGLTRSVEIVTQKQAAVFFDDNYGLGCQL